MGFNHRRTQPTHGGLKCLKSVVAEKKLGYVKKTVFSSGDAKVAEKKKSITHRRCKMAEFDGTNRCPVCNNILYEHVDDRGDDYWKCSVCSHKRRIFHKPIRCVPRYPRTTEPEDYPTGHA